MIYYPEPDNHISDQNELDHATGVDTSDLAAKKDFIALKAEVDKLDIAKFVKLKYFH